VYVVKLRLKGKPVALPFNTPGLAAPVPDFIKKFAAMHASPVENAALERTWHFEEKVCAAGSSRGYVHYGTFGYESNLRDSKTAKRRYKRRVSDVEEIPLFYEFWFPAGSTHGFALFQSFKGRSCIQIVCDRIKEAFEQENSAYRISFSKLMPTDPQQSPFGAAAVKRIRLIKRKASGDAADKYLGEDTPDEVDFELSISARPKGTLGKFAALFKVVKENQSAMFIHDGVRFNEAVADIRVGDRLRRVGIFGVNSDAGLIDLTNDVTMGPDGHPVFASMVKEADALLKDFHSALSGSKS
jgi:hypothetical protein